MFIGHFAVGLAAKKAAPRVNLGVAFVACQLLDLIWPVLVLAGIEHVGVDHAATVVTPLDFIHYPYSHSLLMAVLYSAGFGAFVGWLWESKSAGAVMGGAVLSHWVLDWITHRPDLPLWFSGPKTGLGLWDSLPGALVVELLLFAAGVTLYWRTARPATRGRVIAFWCLIAFLLLVYGANVLGPKPPADAPQALIAGPALAMWLLVLWGWAVDRPAPDAEA